MIGGEEGGSGVIGGEGREWCDRRGGEGRREGVV